MDIRFILIQIFVILFAITIHEAAHAWTASKLGDPTAAAMGRISLNPLAHIDPIGTIIFPLLLILFKQPVFGWAKPVPFNPLNLRHPRRDNLWISFAGPISNLVVAGVGILLFLILKTLASGITSSSFLMKPLGGLSMILVYMVVINMSLAIFNLIPIPPLDGSGVLAGLLSEKAAARYERIRPYGFFIIIALMYTNILTYIFAPVRKLIEYLIG